MKKKIWAVLLAGTMVFTAACGSTDDYSAYEDAYHAMSEPGSLDADVKLSLVTEEETVEADGNMKMNQDGQMYYEMTVGDTNVVQFMKDGILYSDVDGVKTTYDTNSKSAERPKTEGDPMKEDASGFDLSAFLEEFASMMEAGKIKEMGLFDPIPKEALSDIKSSEDGDGKKYTLSMPDSFVEKLFNSMIEEQVSDDANALKFSDLSGFQCVMHVNSKDVLDNMYYAGKTDVTVPGTLVNGEDRVITMDIQITVGINHAGEDVEVPQPDTTGF